MGDLDELGEGRCWCLRSVLDRCSVLDMTKIRTNKQCVRCFNDEPGPVEPFTTTGPRGGKVTRYRCVDRDACAARMRENVELAADDYALELEIVTDSLRLTRQDEKELLEHQADVIRRAIGEGVGVTVIARATGLSRERIYQIRDGRR